MLWYIIPDVLSHKLNKWSCIMPFNSAFSHKYLKSDHQPNEQPPTRRIKCIALSKISCDKTCQKIPVNVGDTSKFFNFVFLLVRWKCHYRNTRLGRNKRHRYRVCSSRTIHHYYGYDRKIRITFLWHYDDRDSSAKRHNEN